MWSVEPKIKSAVKDAIGTIATFKYGLFRMGALLKLLTWKTALCSWKKLVLFPKKHALES